MNDGRYQPYDEEVFQTYHQDMTELVEKLQAINATSVLMTPTMYDSRAARLFPRKGRVNPPERLELYNSVLSYFGTWLREVAVEGGHGFVDMYSPLNNLTLQERKQDARFTIIHDAVHPDAPGQVVMAYAIIDSLATSRSVSNIRIGRSPKGEAVGKGQGGTVHRR